MKKQLILTLGICIAVITSIMIADQKFNLNDREELNEVIKILE